MNWISVRERMPPDTLAVLVWCPERKNYYSARWVVPYWVHFAPGSDRMNEDVSHWMHVEPPNDPF